MFSLHRPAARLLGAALAVLLAVAVSAATATPALAAGPHSRGQLTYIAMGDSYAAGQGGGAYLNACNQTAAGYPALLDSERRITLLRNLTCAGSRTTDVLGSQAGDLVRGVKLVTVTVGGNDLDLVGLGAACAADFSSAACASAVAARRAQLPELAAKLLSTYRAIAARAPRATILVAGYPALVGFEPVLSATADLNSTIRSAVCHVARRGVDIRYVDVSAAFQGHGMESADSWFVRNGVDALHPTEVGYRAYKAALRAAL
jgi:lysophospholipase L1-like esterase